MAKTNTFLASFAKKLEQQHLNRRMMASEVDRMAAILAAHEICQVGPGRAQKFMDSYNGLKMQIADYMLEDLGDGKKNGDRELCKTRHDLAITLRAVFGPSWETCKKEFPLLREFWEAEP